MRTSELIKALFKLMGKHGDIEVVGEFEVKGNELHLKEVGFTEEESTILPSITEKEDSTYL